MGNCYVFPITTEYESRGCTVKINAAANPHSVEIDVENNKTHYGSRAVYVLPVWTRDKGYTDDDYKIIKEMTETLLNTFGEDEWETVHFTNQILS